MNCVICNKEIENSNFSNDDLCSSDCHFIHYWNEKVKYQDDPNVVRVKGEQYYISDENVRGTRGFGGRKYKIRFFDGREVTTTNLWYNGVIPITHTDKLLDNAEFID